MRKTKTKSIKICMLNTIALYITGCEQAEDLYNDKNLPGAFKPGILIINEGNSGSGNGSVSYPELVESKMYNRIFQEVNSVPLGDIPQSMFITDSIEVILEPNSMVIHEL